MTKIFGDRAYAALDLFELVELAWHDCYAEITPSEKIIDDILELSEGDLGKLITYGHLAVIDWRDLEMQMIALRKKKDAQ